VTIESAISFHEKTQCPLEYDDDGHLKTLCFVAYNFKNINDNLYYPAALCVTIEIKENYRAFNVIK
jgi:hypothetical protein